MTENMGTKTKRATWIKWAHAAGVAYPVAIWALVVGFVAGGTIAEGMLIVGLVMLTVGTFAAVGGVGRYLATK